MANHEMILEAARVLIALVRQIEKFEDGRSEEAMLSVDIETRDGQTEQWEITIARVPERSRDAA